MTYDFIIGMDVGKYFHHACVLNCDGKQVLSKRINQNEKALRELFARFLTHNHHLLVVVDHRNNIRRLTVATAQDMGATVRYLPGLAMRQPSRIHAGNSKTNIRDAYVIAHAGRNIPDALRTVDRTQEAFLQLKVLNGIDEDLARSYTRVINQIRSALIRNLSYLRTSTTRTDPPPQMDPPPACSLQQTNQNQTPRQKPSHHLRPRTQSTPP